MDPELEKIVSEIQKKITDAYKQEINNLVSQYPALQNSKEEILERLEKQLAVIKDGGKPSAPKEMVLKPVMVGKNEYWLGPDNYLYDSGVRIGKLNPDGTYWKYDNSEEEQKLFELQSMLKQPIKFEPTTD